jgi:hypothetical protein
MLFLKNKNKNLFLFSLVTALIHDLIVHYGRCGIG